jgi:segregation and condensation protein A
MIQVKYAVDASAQGSGPTGGLAGYQLRLPSFEGPLDVLLRLIERQQLPIADVSLVMVTDQFFAYLEEIDDAPPSSIAEFAAVGARLVLLKARSLLPRAPVDSDDHEDDDLVIQLIEYRAIKEAAKHFGDLDNAGTRAFARGERAVELPVRPVELPLARHEPVSLVRALKRRLTTMDPPATVVAMRPLIPLRLMVTRIYSALSQKERSYLEISRNACGSPEEARAMFLALLVLIRRRHVDAVQHEPFGDITVWKAEGSAGLGELLAMDESSA